jgi:hypothetical protein
VLKAAKLIRTGEVFELAAVLSPDPKEAFINEGRVFNIYTKQLQPVPNTRSVNAQSAPAVPADPPSAGSLWQMPPAAQRCPSRWGAGDQRGSGNWMKPETVLKAAKLIRTGNARGVHVAGTSAGASILSEHMIAFGKEGSSPRASSVRLAPGLGLTNRFIIDQHFRQRDRLGRLTAALAYNPFAIGIGLDEDTAAFISPDDTLEVEGSGAVTVVDAHDLQFSSMAHADEDEPVCMLGLGVHILIAGATFNLHTRRASAGRLATRKT